MTTPWDADHYRANASFVMAGGSSLLSELGDIAGQRILDLGCGEGELTQKLAETGAHVFAIDASPSMVESTRARGIKAEVMDARSLAFDQEFDGVFTNAVLHWINPLESAVAAVAKALKPGGWFHGEFGGFGNVAAIVTALHAARETEALPQSDFAWSFPTPTAFTAILERNGFTVEAMLHFPRPTPLPTGMSGWLDTFSHVFTSDLTEGQSGAVRRQAVEFLEPAMCDNDGNWWADYWRLRFRAIKN